MKRKYLILFSLSGLVLCCDQLAKRIVQGALTLGDRHPLIPGFLTLCYTRNNGFAFGFLQHAPPSIQNIFFIGVPAFALILIILIFIKLQDNQILTSIALTTILAGAVGNLVDRFNYGYVVDFIEFHIKNTHLPAFNLADGSILVGVLIMIVGTFRQENRGGATDGNAEGSA